MPKYYYTLYYFSNIYYYSMRFDILPFLEKHYWKDDTIVIACSTWADSMFLLYHILETPYKNNLVACYLNHNTREQCKQEERFLEKLWNERWFKVEIADCNFTKIQKLYPSKSFEELAREKRYQFFDAVCNIYNTNKVILAHHLDDKIETYIFNMLRGTKLTGLINMTESSGGILRPLLDLEKRDIYKYLQENNLTYFEDESNSENTYTRNYLRNEVLPSFDRVHPEHKRNISNLLSYFEEIKEHLDTEVNKFLLEEKYFSVSKFILLSSLMQKEVIREVFYRTNFKSTIWLSEWNIAETIKFINWKNNKTKKEIQNMKLFKDWDKIMF